MFSLKGALPLAWRRRMRRHHWRFVTWGIVVLGAMLVLLSLQEEPPSPLVLEDGLVPPDTKEDAEPLNRDNSRGNTDRPPVGQPADHLVDRVVDQPGNPTSDLRLAHHVPLVGPPVHGPGDRPGRRSVGRSAGRPLVRESVQDIRDPQRGPVGAAVPDEVGGHQRPPVGMDQAHNNSRALHLLRAQVLQTFRPPTTILRKVRPPRPPLLLTALVEAPIGQQLKLYMSSVGGFGNQLFEIASGIGIALSTKRQLLLSPFFEDTLSSFDVSLPVQEAPPDTLRVEAHAFATFDQNVYNLPRADCAFQGFFQSWKYFRQSEHVIREQFQPKAHLKEIALNVKMNACAVLCYRGNPHIPKPFNATKVCNCRTRLYIGVHIRRNLISPNYNAVPEYYFQMAMGYFRSRYLNPIFIVVSDTFSWARARIGGHDVYVVPPMPGEEHFALLASCAHHVLSVGTFGWWAAWLAGGTTVYYGDPVPWDFEHRDEFTASDYFPNHWIRKI